MYRKRRESCGSASGAEFLLRNHQAAHRPGKPARCSGAAKREAPAENGRSRGAGLVFEAAAPWRSAASWRWGPHALRTYQKSPRAVLLNGAAFRRLYHGRGSVPVSPAGASKTPVRYRAPPGASSLRPAGLPSPSTYRGPRIHLYGIYQAKSHQEGSSVIFLSGREAFRQSRYLFVRINDRSRAPFCCCEPHERVVFYYQCVIRSSAFESELIERKVLSCSRIAVMSDQKR